jgi:hypothetical protein
MSAIEWRHSRNRILIPLLIFPPDPHDLRLREVTALLDTGATTSAITGDVARSLDLRVIGKRPVASAHGDAQVERYLFRIGLQPRSEAGSAFPYLFEAIDGFQIRTGFAFDAILGMDILSQCDFQMRRNGDCLLTFGT